jgi:hypothetical protein
MERHILFLNDLSDYEFRVFIYSRLFKRSQEQIAIDLKTNKVKINKICRTLFSHSEFINLKEEILEAFFTH